MNFFRVFFFISSCWVLTCVSHAKIITVESFGSIPELLYLPLGNKQEFLYIFDIDETLITYKDLALREHNRESTEGKKLQAYFNANCKKPNDSQYGQYIWSQIFIQAHKVLIEPRVKDIISNLQKNKLPVIALTRLLTGEYGVIPNLQDWRYSQLLSFGIDFSKSSPLNKVALKELKSKKISSPVLYKGILFTDSYSKKETLQVFLNKFEQVKGFLPKKIIYIDDTLSYLEDVQTLCRSLGIKFVGYHYLGSQSLPGEFNIELAKEQINHLLLYESWISDAQTHSLLQKL